MGSIGDTLTPGQVLNQGDYMEATDGTCWLWIEGTGNIVLFGKTFPAKTDPADATGTNQPALGPYTMHVSSAGYIVAKARSGVDVWTSPTDFKEGINEHFLRLIDGKSILYQGTPATPRRALWQMWSRSRGGEVLLYRWLVTVKEKDGTRPTDHITGAKYATAAEAAASTEAKDWIENAKNGGLADPIATASEPR